MKNKPHKHADIIKAWADGAEIEIKDFNSTWLPMSNPPWNPINEYRIKPQEDPYKELKEAFYANKTIQYRFNDGVWVDMLTTLVPPVFIANPFKLPVPEPSRYRIKTKQKLVPFTWEDREQLRDRWVKFKGENTEDFAGEYLITTIFKDRVYIDTGWYSFINLKNNFEFIDGSPCGKYVETNDIEDD